MSLLRDKNRIDSESVVRDSLKLCSWTLDFAEYRWCVTSLALEGNIS
jgi:hypothetical protein